MRVFRATYKDRSGRKREADKWYVEFVDHDGRPRRLPGFSDKQQAETLGRKIEKLIECKQNRETPGRELSAWLETLPARMQAKLAAWGVIDGCKVAASKPLTEHLKDFQAALIAKGTGQQHAETTTGRVRRLFTDCGFVHWSNLDATAIVAKLADWRKPDPEGKPGTSIQTSNYHVQSVKQFCAWMVRDGRATQSPVRHLTGQNAKTDRRHERRAFAVEELRWLLSITAGGPERLGMAGEDRAVLYRLAVETGLRSNELRSLTRSSFDFRTEPATVTVAAGYSKRRREDTLPLLAGTATLLRAFVATKLPAARVFNLPRPEMVVKMLRRDLEAARVAWLEDAAGNLKLLSEREQSDFLIYRDAAERVADFHSFRHTFISNLARGGCHPKLAQALARHSTITLTMDRYSHTVLGEQSDALAALPDLSGPVGQQQRATGTDGRAVAIDQVNREAAGANEAPEICLADCLAELPSDDSVCTHRGAVSGPQESRGENRKNRSDRRTKRGILPIEKRVDGGGIEPPTHGFSVHCSTN